MASGPPVNIRVYYGSQFGYLDQKRNLMVKLWPFGPSGWGRCVFVGLESEQLWVTYYTWLSFTQNIAKDALNKVLHKSDLSREALLKKLANLITDTRAAYPAPNADAADALNAPSLPVELHHAPPAVQLQGLDDNTVLIRLAEDTCLWLLVVLSILGAKPDFPEQHPIFGSRRVTEDKEMWIRSIFFVGNQIPFFWVKKLMESLTYLTDLKHQIGKQIPSELLPRTLFELVICSQRTLFELVICSQGKTRIWMLESNPNNIVNQQLSASALGKQGCMYNPLHKISGYRAIKCTHIWGEVDVGLFALMVDDEMSVELTSA